jgi:hypothetical protein
VEKTINNMSDARLAANLRKKTKSAVLGEEGTERRVTFIVRLTVDERGQPRRTEIEHARSGERETFPSLDVQRLTAFMERCISLPNHPATDDSPSSTSIDS